MVIFTRLIILFCFAGPLSLRAQDKDIIKVKRPVQGLYFFQEGVSSDTISFNSHDLFYMCIPAQLRCRIRIEVKNGMLVRTGCDSIFQLKRMLNMNYIHYYTDAVYNRVNSYNDKPRERCSDYITAPNGITQDYAPHVVRISFYNASKDSLLLFNHFYYK